MKAIVPMPTVSLGDDDKKSFLELLEKLRGLEDVVDVWSNLAD
jgi:transcriptional/translational regulatory protein YebC/TACO1